MHWELNDINDLYAKLRVLDVIKDMNIKVFDLMSRTNETRQVSWHQTSTCKYRLDTSICNNKQRWNNSKYRYDCKELIDKGKQDDGFIWDPSLCECECDKSYSVGKYSDYSNWNCRKRLIDKLAEECSEDINGNDMISNNDFK